ncbi:RBBP9/YdeN family alpha/beta hydrolase [Acetobacter oeni]|uniref:Alpha/beta hydrolase n=1 Tax=Acetobacter oeni TaxID=304077 RepID=A0A511XMG3_9PROT|nr:alpha/beta fold hydrolase [Acetobacter oeni]MBB3883683.1 hypothetical protein [Acetobacter oeni]NHO19736.1 alpha/beta fold hydrolase [Acetobacter oeni]GEN64118.1 hypothetical protein AOE01nite_23420 [Acetobacter oeni]
MKQSLHAGRSEIRKTGFIPHSAVPLTVLPEDIVKALAGFEIVIVPGLDDSGQKHWQSQWETLFSEKNLRVDRVRQESWTYPVRARWQAGLADALQNRRRPVLLITHSLGAVLSAGFHDAAIAGALLVAPADTEQCTLPDHARIADFSPLPSGPLNFPALLVASRNDEWLSLTRARRLATAWSLEFFDAGAVGHIGNNNPEPGYWPDGLNALRRLLEIMNVLPPTPHSHRTPDRKSHS